MRRITITIITLATLAACGPTADADGDLDTKPGIHQLEDDELEDGSTGLGATSDPTEESTGGERGSGGASSSSDESTGAAAESTTGEPEATVCILPATGSACEATVEAGEAIHCAAVGGSCWAVVAAQYFLGDAVLAQQVSECEADCAALEDACAFVPAGVPENAVCHMTDEADCLATATAAGIPFDESVGSTCVRLAEVY